MLGLSLKFPRTFWSKRAAYIVLGTLTVVFLLGLLDENFKLIVGKADNIPIVGLIFMVLFFTWLAMYQAINNDQRLENSQAVAEAEVLPEKVLVWPDLVYIELIAMIVGSIVLIIWSILVAAPIEQPADPFNSPNPAKAPWYFLGLQEILVYFDPWIAGVLIPGLCILGLMAIPYIDTNRKGSGYYSFKDRKTAISIFLFGWIILWVLLIIIGTFLRGPNWNFFGPFEVWDIHKIEPLVNINFSEIIFIKILGIGLPNNWFLREIFGIFSVAGYILILPIILARNWFSDLYESIGPGRYAVFMTLLLLMMAVPIKMYLRWLFNLKYIIAIPEYFFNV